MYTDLAYDVSKTVENMNEQAVLDIASQRRKKYAVLLDPQYERWNKYSYNKATVYNMETLDKTIITTENGGLK